MQSPPARHRQFRGAAGYRDHLFYFEQARRWPSCSPTAPPRFACSASSTWSSGARCCRNSSSPGAGAETRRARAAGHRAAAGRRRLCRPRADAQLRRARGADDRAPHRRVRVRPARPRNALRAAGCRASTRRRTSSTLSSTAPAMPSAVGEDGTGHVRRRAAAVAGAICALLWGYLGWQLGKQADRRTEVRVGTAVAGEGV